MNDAKKRAEELTMSFYKHAYAQLQDRNVDHSEDAFIAAELAGTMMTAYAVQSFLDAIEKENQ